MTTTKNKGLERQQIGSRFLYIEAQFWGNLEHFYLTKVGPQFL